MPFIHQYHNNCMSQRMVVYKLEERVKGGPTRGKP